MTRTFASLALLLASATQALAGSATFYMSGVCDGQDAPQNHPSQMVNFSDLVAYAAQRGVTIAGPVYITGVQARMLPMDSRVRLGVQYIFAGDSDEPDILAWGDQCRDGISYCIGSDTPSMVYPPMRFGQGHTDLHNPCSTAGAQWQAFYTIYYSLIDPFSGA